MRPQMSGFAVLAAIQTLAAEAHRRHDNADAGKSRQRLAFRAVGNRLDEERGNEQHNHHDDRHAHRLDPLQK